MLLLPIVGNAGEPDDIPLFPEAEFSHENQRNEADTNFTAELLTNGSIKVLSSDVTTFTVKICNASTGAVLYQGSTVNGILHITTLLLQVGHYELQIETADACYNGMFNINQ